MRGSVSIHVFLVAVAALELVSLLRKTPFISENAVERWNRANVLPFGDFNGKRECFCWGF